MNSRYYNPEWGRFINADGIVGITGDLLSYNMFAYCKNNPVNLSDPSGYWSGNSEYHEAVQYEVVFYLLSLGKDVDWEIPVPNSGSKGGTGRMDIYCPTTGEIWEIKPDRFWHYNSGPKQLGRYISNVAGSKAGGEIFPGGKYTFDYKDKIIEIRQGTGKQKGMIYYKVLDKNNKKVNVQIIGKIRDSRISRSDPAATFTGFIGLGMAMSFAGGGRMSFQMSY